MKLLVSDNSSVHHQEFFAVHSNGYMSYSFADSWRACSQAVSKPVVAINSLCLVYLVLTFHNSKSLPEFIFL